MIPIIQITNIFFSMRGNEKESRNMDQTVIGVTLSRFSVVKPVGRSLHPANRIQGANWCVGKQVFIIIECNGERAICMLHVMSSENAEHNV